MKIYPAHKFYPLTPNAVLQPSHPHLNLSKLQPHLQITACNPVHQVTSPAASSQLPHTAPQTAIIDMSELCIQTSPTPQLAVLQQRIIDEFIFCPHNDNKNKSNPAKVLSFSINELIVVRVLSEHLAAMASPSLRNGLLLVLFHPSSLDQSQQHTPYSSTANNASVNPYVRPPPLLNNPGGGNPYTRNVNNPYSNPMNPYAGHMGPYNNSPYGPNGGNNPYNNSNQFGGKSGGDGKVSHRLSILSALVSLAVATRNTEVLEGAAVWMQQVCCLSGWSGQVCKRLIAEYCTDDDQQATAKSRAGNNTAANCSLNSGSNGISDEEVDGDGAPHHPLHNLPSVTSFFTANLITCWAQLYARLGVMHKSANDGRSTGVCRRPPLPLLQLVVSWLRHSPPVLLLTPLTLAPAVAAGGMMPPVTVTTAVAPLLRWCVEAPFFLHSATARMQVKTEQQSTASDTVAQSAISPAKNSSPTKSILSTTPLKPITGTISTLKSLESSLDGVSNTDSDDAFRKKTKRLKGLDTITEERELYNELHLCLLRALHAVPAELPLPAQRQVLCTKQVITVVEGLVKLLEPSTTSPPSAGAGAWRRGNSAGDLTAVVEAVSLQGKMEAVNRLAQVILIAIKTNCLFGSHGDLWTVLRRLPIYNRLVKILLTSHQGSQ